MKRYLIIACVLFAAAFSAYAYDSGQAVIAHLSKQLRIKPSDITPTPVPGLYQIRVGPQVNYVTADGHYFIRGEIIDLKSGYNLTVAERDKARLQSLAKIGQSKMIVFAPPHPTQRITVLTDVDCEYCRLLEHERPALNAMGIEVRYLFYPRDGVGTPGWNKAVAVWCAKDQKAAFTAAMQGKQVKSAHCNAAPVAAGYEFAQQLGINGTPAIITDHGRMIDGYLPLEAMASVLGVDPHKFTAARNTKH